MPNNAQPQSNQNSTQNQSSRQPQSKQRSNEPSQDNQGKPGFENEGEGNKTAGRNYDDKTEQYVKSGRVDAAAEEAKRAVDSPEGEELRDAEKRGRDEARNMDAKR